MNFVAGDDHRHRHEYPSRCADRRSEIWNSLSGCVSPRLGEGAVVACEIVWTETAAFFPKRDLLVEVMRELNIDFSDITLDTALEAGRIWRAYRTRGGRRERVAADFLIGAHATLQADRLLTRDRGFYRDYFSKLRLIDPGTRA